MTDDPQRMVTYRPADPDEFFFAEGIKWWTDLDWLEGFWDAADVVEEVWVLQSSRTFTWRPPCAILDCEAPAEHWGLCEPHAR